LQLREITILPGGQIAKHSHETRPGLVKVIDGAWIEGRADGERTYSSADAEGILEDRETVHWFWNRGETPGTAIVCDIVPAG
jgi:quercetin dioxygenase-like cupin family protein